jgi:heme-degrading monooxygenase HmoA
MSSTDVPPTDAPGMDVPPTGPVTLHLWHVPTAAVPRALGHMAADHVHLRRQPGLRFAKLLGTGTGRTFTIRDADPRRWALLTVWQDEAAAEAFDAGSLVARWRRISAEEWTAHLLPLTSRGRWSGRQPFGSPPPIPWDGPVAAITRARLAPARARRFWRAVPPVSAELHQAPGLLLALGIGEAPLGLQGTFSLWRSSQALDEFAYRGDAHLDAVRRTRTESWYAEELFARFALLSSRGTVGGADPAGRT